METREILNYLGEIIGELSLPEGTTEEQWEAALAPYSAAPIIPTMQQIVEKKITDAKEFGDKLLNEFATENVLMGITQAGKTIEVTDYLHKLSHYMMTGSLYAALTEIDVILADTNRDHLAPFVTTERMEIYKDKIKQFLGL
jgi:hypothetical protein